MRVNKIQSVICGTGDAQGLAQFARARGQLIDTRIASFNPRLRRICAYALQRLQRTKQHPAGIALWQATNVETSVQSVNVVDVRMTRRAVENRIAGGASAGCVRGRVMFPEIRFGLHDASREWTASAAAHKDFS